jgi:hypothetical protein
MTNQYRIVDENGEEYASAGVVAACAKLQGVSPKFQAEFDVVRLNDEVGYRAFREERVTGKDAAR